MADRFFPNIMPDFVAETPTSPTQEAEPEIGSSSLMKLLSMPYPSLSERFKRTALDLKETILTETWGATGQRVHDFTLYSGALGTALLLFKSYQVTSNTNDLSLCSQIIKACDSASLGSRDVTFICGRAGICALGAVAAKHLGRLSCQEISLMNCCMGKLGFLWACLFLNKHLGEGTISSAYMRAVVDEIIKNGRALGKRGRCPLMFEWYGEKYWGAAHGLAGIMDVLMDMELKPDELKMSRVFGDKEFMEAAVDAAEMVWKRGLLKRVGICHGISGNAYVFLSLYQLTGNLGFLYRAKAFACFLVDRANKLISEGELHRGDSPYSLFEGVGGMAYLLLDMIEPSQAKFPAYEQ
ncbi:unnamed protein product [Prunus armeniaca]|uniref:LanC-like protein GCL2 n=1 Tax=Prunus armeniaca TaxID=36596 RepID=A0A6J5UB26_PRUAR|nr:unnamed protein product [Prunus armeniaca]